MNFNRKRVQEIALVVLVGLAATLANLQEEMLERFDIDRGFLLGSLALVVFIALFLYLKFQFFFLVVLLAVAANMPGEVAEGLGISTLPLVIAMATMVGFSLINYVVDLLPTGLEKRPKQQSSEGIKVLFYAIEKGNLIYAQKVLSQNFDPNLVAENGYTPLMYAAARGDSKMVELLLRNGADVNMVSKDGDTAIELALRIGSQECADILKKARADQGVREQAARPPQAKRD
ncbi:MAG TPA: ankyrin repeat domain-containing protein [Burkholderiales bacterium]|nr:ankyrin repeat domain-containing protein [Burkholderiales bacterium]